MPVPDASQVVEELPSSLRPALAPLVRHAMGLATGAVLGVALALLALSHAIVGPLEGSDLWVWLIGNSFFFGYAPTFVGALYGLAWGFATGFVLGFVLAAGRNAIISVWMFWVAARERARANRTVLDELM